jgi:hypothetical protein
MSRKNKLRLTMLILVLGIIFSAILQRLLCSNWQPLALTLYGFNTLNHFHTPLTVLSHTLLIMSLFELAIALVIMSIRIFTQKISPVADKDTLAIALLNRILMNNIEQSFVFFGLYAYLLLGHS